MSSYKNEHIVNIFDDSDDLKQLLWMASNGDRDAFIDQLSWMSIGYYKKNMSIQFVFPKSLTSNDRNKIHRMQSANKVRYYTTYTDEKGSLNLFIDKY